MAVRTLKIVYPNLLSIGCFSQTIDRVIEQGSQWLPTVQLAGGAAGGH